jgi:SAM-dependent methyltransferase
MNWWTLPRTPEPEVMSDADEVEAYASAAGQAYLDSIDNTLVQQVLQVGAECGILGNRKAGAGPPAASAEPCGNGAPTVWLLDVGTGPGSIPLKIARHCPDLGVVGVDRSPNMIRVARQSAAHQGLTERAFFFVGEASRLAFAEARFEMVISNSLLHHLPQPISVLNEMARVVKPAGVVLLRDLRRPSRLAFPLHVRWFGRYYSRVMKKLYVNSVRAAYTGPELAALVHGSKLAHARVFFHHRTHLGFIRAATR